MTPNQITIGNVSSRTNPFGSDQFTPNYYGLISFVQHCNALGGINGRTIQIVPCNDGGQDSGNVSCVNNMVSQHAFSMVANNIFTYPAGAKVAYQNHLPDIGGEPISGAPYYTYPKFFNIYGDGYPKDGKHAGYKGKYWGTSELGAYFAKEKHVTKAGVVYYDQKDSQRGFNAWQATLGNQGIKVYGHAVNLADPNYQAAVVNMKKEGDQMVFDAIDQAGNQQLCQAMNSYSFATPPHPIAKVSTIAAWSDHVGTDFAPPCRDIVWASGSSANYDDTSIPMVNTFRQDFSRYGQGQVLAQWAVEGYAAGIWFAQAAHSCGSNLTRSLRRALAQHPELIVRRRTDAAEHQLPEEGLHHQQDGAGLHRGRQLEPGQARLGHARVDQPELLHDALLLIRVGRLTGAVQALT